MSTTHRRRSLLLLFASLHAATPTNVATADTNATAYDLLTLFGFPKGLLPGNVVGYTKSDGRHFTVELSGTCYIQFSNLAHHEKKNITGRITCGRLSGIQVSKFFIWFAVTSLHVDVGDSTIVLSDGLISEKHFRHPISC